MEIKNQSGFNPKKIIKELDIQAGEIVADLGCGAGHFSIPIAQKVGDEGQVHAFDILEKRLEAVQSFANLNLLNNVFTHRVNLEEPGSVAQALNGKKADTIIISDVLFANEKKINILKEAADNLKPQGMLAVIDWKQSSLPSAPPSELLVAPQAVQKAVQSLGLTPKKELKAGDSHWGILFVKP